MSGIGIMFARAVIIYKTRFQKAIALSSTEAKFYALCEAGKMTLYVRSILDELGIDQLAATHVFEDNDGCLNLVTANQPTRRTRHIEIREFAIQDLIKGDLLNAIKVNTHINISDAFTKSLSKILFHRHFDVLMGKRPPTYIIKYMDVGRINVLYAQSSTIHPIVPYYNSSHCEPQRPQHDQLGGVLYVPRTELVGV